MTGRAFVRLSCVQLLSLALIVSSMPADAAQSQRDRARRIVKVLDAYEAQIARRIKQLEARGKSRASKRSSATEELFP